MSETKGIRCPACGYHPSGSVVGRRGESWHAHCWLEYVESIMLSEEERKAVLWAIDAAEMYAHFWPGLLRVLRSAREKLT